MENEKIGSEIMNVKDLFNNFKFEVDGTLRSFGNVQSQIERVTSEIAAIQ